MSDKVRNTDEHSLLSMSDLKYPLVETHGSRDGLNPPTPTTTTSSSQLGL